MSSSLRSQKPGSGRAAPGEPVAAAAIERTLAIYEQFKERDRTALMQARKAVTAHIYGMVAEGETDEQRLTIGGLTALKRREREGDGSTAGNPD